MRKNLVWALGSGTTVQFWNHRWIPNLDRTLSEVAIQNVPDHLLYKNVDYFVNNSSWDWSKFEHLLPGEVSDLIAAIMPPEVSHGDMDDIAFWGLSSSGNFSIKTAYGKLVVGSPRSSGGLLWRSVWNWYGPQRIRTFFWVLLNNGILVNEERARRCLSATSICPLCGQEPESSLHMLRDCLDARRTWEGLLRCDGTERFFDVSSSIWDWIRQNMTSNWTLGCGMRWCTLFGVGCWLIWKKRCGFIFKEERVSPEGLIARIIAMAKNVEVARLVDEVGSRVDRPPILVGWRPPWPDTLKLNTDASLEGGTGCAFGGGLIRDTVGNWKGGFVAKIGICSILNAEIWSLFYGLRLAKDLGFRKLEVESDSYVGVSMIMGRFHVSQNCWSIVKRVQSLCQEFESVVIKHVHREGNFAADFLSHHAYSFQRGVHVLENPPPDLCSWLLHDRLNISYLR